MRHSLSNGLGTLWGAAACLGATFLLTAHLAGYWLNLLPFSDRWHPIAEAALEGDTALTAVLAACGVTIGLSTSVAGIVILRVAYRRDLSFPVNLRGIYWLAAGAWVSIGLGELMAAWLLFVPAFATACLVQILKVGAVVPFLYVLAADWTNIQEDQLSPDELERAEILLDQYRDAHLDDQSRRELLRQTIEAIRTVRHA